jgi:hypothetical protein
MFSGESDIALRRLSRGYKCVNHVLAELYGPQSAFEPASALVTGGRDIESARSYLEEGDIKNALSNTYAAYRRLQLSLGHLV